MYITYIRRWSVIKSNKEIMMMALIIRRGNYLKYIQLISWDSWGSEWSSCFQFLWPTDLAISTTVFAARMSTYLSCLGFYLVVLVKRYRCWHTLRSFSWGLLFPCTESFMLKGAMNLFFRQFCVSKIFIKNIKIVLYIFYFNFLYIFLYGFHILILKNNF